MSAGRDDARRAAEAWLAEWAICPHDTGVHPICPTCAESLADVIDSVAESRGRGSTVVGELADAPTEHDRALAECHALVDRLHAGLEVLADDDDDAVVVERLRAFRLALLKFAYREAGDPEAEETLAREGHSV